MATSSSTSARVVGAAAWLLAGVYAYDNGVGRTPAMGFSSWNAFSSNVTEARMRNITNILVSSGLAAKGYKYINVDEGWLQSRAPNGTIVEDFVKFPSGMKGFGDWVHSQCLPDGSCLKYGLYTCRGTCQCSTPWYQGPGSNGYEKADSEWMVDAGADYLKVDSCCGSQDHDTAFAEYALFRDALNATGREVYFSLCGWESWYAPVGYSLGNQWRIAGDGSGWGPLTNCMNVISTITQYAGAYGFNDPDLLIGPDVLVGSQTEQQARTQFSVWAVIGAPLIISDDLQRASDYMFETYGNEEVIAVDQDPAIIPGFRAVGTNLTYPCTGNGLPDGALAEIAVLPCNASDTRQVWRYNADGTLQLVAGAGKAVMDVWMCGTDDGAPVYLYPADNGAGTCGGRNQQWTMHAGSNTITNNYSGACLDVYDFAGPNVDTWACNGGDNQAFTLGADGTLRNVQGSKEVCVAAVQPDPATCTNVWLRQLGDGSIAVAMVNNGADAATVTCDAACFAQASIPASVGSLVVRDLWAHANVTTLVRGPGGGFSFAANVTGDGGSNLYRMFPVV